ncbi:MAG: hypothetical protein J0H07_03215 [Sphingobacteriales bacterium]|nr:hypothetical protein [Sphingobacteriales bacterium]
MKHLSMISLITCLAFTPAGKQSSLPVEHPSSVISFQQSSLVQHSSVAPDCNQTAVNWVEANDLSAADMQTIYYWFLYPDEIYWDHKSLNDEINEMWMYYGAPVDTRPTGGSILIDRGYLSSVYPHITYAFQYLYVHF